MKAYNKFVIGYAKYSDETAQYNERVVNKNTALAVVVSAFETFHPSKDEYALRYDSLVEKFEKFDSGDRRAVQGCGLTDCQVEAICTNKLKNKFESLVNVETCSAAKPPDEAMQARALAPQRGGGDALALPRGRRGGPGGGAEVNDASAARRARRRRRFGHPLNRASRRERGGGDHTH